MLPRRKRQIPESYTFIFPNIFTTGNLFCGFFSIISSLKYDFEVASYAILFASIFDLVDGRIARMLNKTSSFGKEYDSLADMVSFGVAPSVLAYIYILAELPKYGWLICFLFVAAGALRLSRYNVISETSTDLHLFLGLPIPIAASLISSAVLFYENNDYDFYVSYIFIVLMFISSFLMVSTIKFTSFKKLVLKGRKSILKNLVFLILLIFVVSIDHTLMFFVVFSSYIILNIIVFYYKLIFKKNNQEHN